MSSLVKEMKFSLEIDVTGEEGVPKATLENKIKETIGQIGANPRNEEFFIKNSLTFHQFQVNSQLM